MNEHRIDQLARMLATRENRRTFVTRLGGAALAAIGLAARQHRAVGAEDEPPDEPPDESPEDQAEEQPNETENQPNEPEDQPGEPEDQPGEPEDQPELQPEQQEDQEDQEDQEEEEEQEDQPQERQQFCRTHFVAGSISLRAQDEEEDEDGNTRVLRTYGVDRVRCSCQGVCLTQPGEEDSRRRRPIRERCEVKTGPDGEPAFSYRWSLEVLSPRNGPAPVSIDGAADGEEVTLAWTGEGRARLSVTISGCECCCPDTDDCTAADAKERRLTVSARAQ